MPPTTLHREALHDVPDDHELVTTHLSLVDHAVEQLSRRYPRHVDRAALHEAGVAGLRVAVHEHRDAHRDGSDGFHLFALHHIRAAMIDAAYGMVSRPR